MNTLLMYSPTGKISNILSITTIITNITMNIKHNLNPTTFGSIPMNQSFYLSPWIPDAWIKISHTHGRNPEKGIVSSFRKNEVIYVIDQSKINNFKASML